ncbi:MAG TPA: toll/interleukin-1 receptor domain-containing protein [Casimicrobiaceae bacterium]
MERVERLRGFQSCTRKDYYFAESLAFHLLRSGVPAWMDVKDLKPGDDWERDLENALDAASTLLLVASPPAIESERVRAEWQRALRRGCRVIVVRFRNVNLPSELQACEVVDFRGSFSRALQRLTTHLVPATTGASVTASSSAAGSWPALPPWVVVMTLALAIPTLGYFLAASWDIPADTEYRLFVLLAAPLGALALV